jgi:hypothetical protein
MTVTRAAAITEGQNTGSATSNLNTPVDHLKESYLDEIGFMLFCTQYSNQQSLEAFENGIWELQDEGIAAAHTEPGFNRFED